MDWRAVNRAFDSRQIEWIAFDVGGTLLYPDPPVADVYHNSASRFGSQLTPGEIASRFKDVFHRAQRKDRLTRADWSDVRHFRTNDEVEANFWRAVYRDVLHDVSDSEACFQELYAHFGRVEAWQCYAEVAEVLGRLKQLGYRIALASNWDRRLEMLFGLPELCDIDVRVISSLVGYRKPSLHFYRALLDATACQPHQVLMVGDDYENDVLGAQDAGLSAIFLDRRGTCSGVSGLTDLRQLLTLLER